MLKKRLLVINILIPSIILFIVLGGIPYAALIVLGLSWAAWEYWRIFHNGGYSPSLFVLLLGVVGLAVGRFMVGFQYADLILSVVVLLAMAAHVFHYEQGKNQSAIDLGITLGGVLYLGWLGSYFLSLRNFPDGMWWLLLVLAVVWIEDSGAYLVGMRFGKHPMAPRVSPKKTWEGYLGGVAFGILAAVLIAALWNLRVPSITTIKGLVIGVVISLISPLGDLAESLIKRQFGVKDSGKALPGHGGVLDRIDSWLWTVVIGYYLVVYLH